MKLSDAVLPKVIWLQPWCIRCKHNDCSDTGRLWCEDDVWGKCDECGLPSVKYQIVGRAAISDKESDKA